MTVEIALPRWAPCLLVMEILPPRKLLDIDEVIPTLSPGRCDPSSWAPRCSESSYFGKPPLAKFPTLRKLGCPRRQHRQMHNEDQNFWPHHRRLTFTPKVIPSHHDDPFGCNGTLLLPRKIIVFLGFWMLEFRCWGKLCWGRNRFEWRSSPLCVLSQRPSWSTREESMGAAAWWAKGAMMMHLQHHMQG